MASPALSRPDCPGHSAPPPAPNPRHAAGCGSTSSCRSATAAAPPPPLPGSPGERKEEWGQGWSDHRGRGDVWHHRPTLPRPSTYARRIAGPPGLCLWLEQGAPSWRMAQDGDPEQGRRALKGEENDKSPQNGRGTTERGGGAKNRGPEEETF